MTGSMLHATCVALKALTDQWSGVLLQGPSGCGKSDLALRLIYDLGPECARLVADDYVNVRRSGHSVEAFAPPATLGKIEVRGVGIIELPALERIGVRVAFDLIEAADIPRMPEPRWLQIDFDSGKAQIPLFALAPFEASAVAKIAMIHNEQARKAHENRRPA